MSQYIVCEIKYASSSRMFYYIRSVFAVFKPACFSDHPDPQSFAHLKKPHICHAVLHRYKQSRESAHIWQLIDRMTDDSTCKCKNSCVQLIYWYTVAVQSQVDKCVQMLTFIFAFSFLCSPKFHAKAATDVSASESQFKAYCRDKAVRPNCLHTACNSMYFEKAAAVCTTSKQQKYAI